MNEVGPTIISGAEKLPEAPIAPSPLRSLDVQYDPITDIVVIEGVRFSGDFFRHFKLAERGVLVRISTRDEDGTVHLKKYNRGQTVFA